MRAKVLSLFPVVLVVLGWLGRECEVAAQVRKFGRPGVPASILLTVGEVRDELKLSPEQVRKAREAAEKDLDLERLIESGPADDADKRRRELLAESDKTVTAILTPAQVKRFRQIRLQQAGAVAIADPKLADELKLTKDQRKAVQAIAEDREAKARAAVADPALAPREVATKITELTKAADAEVRKRLTADQRAKWEEMVGEPFRWARP